MLLAELVELIKNNSHGYFERNWKLEKGTFIPNFNDEQE